MSVKETLQNAGQKIADGASQAADWVKEKTGMAEDHPSGVKERMDVIGSCGNKLGVVDHVEDGSIKLTRKDSSDGQHHLIPLSWIDHVDSHVHLNKNCGEARREWRSVPMGA